MPFKSGSRPRSSSKEPSSAKIAVFAVIVAIALFAIAARWTQRLPEKEYEFGIAVATWALTAATLLLVYVVFTQVSEARESARQSLAESDWQRRKWATLQACDRYDMDTELARAVRYLRRYHRYRGTHLLPAGVVAAEQHYARPTVRPEQIPKTLGDPLTSDQRYTQAAGLLLNYFDSIAIGIQQEFYVKEICQEHIGAIFVTWMESFRSVNEERFDKLMKKSFERLPVLYAEWKR